MNFCITGVTNKTHNEIKKVLRKEGHHCGDHIFENTDYLIANYPSETRKYRDALKYNIKIINEKELGDILYAE
jgi:NAD-dependent DNA ligase